MKNKEMVNVTLSAETKQRLFDLMAENDCSLSELMDKFLAEEKQQPEPPCISVQVEIDASKDISRQDRFADLSLPSIRIYQIDCYGEHHSESYKCWECDYRLYCQEFTFLKNFFELKNYE